MKSSVFIATSLDGFIARENGDIDWLPEDDGSGEDYGYDDFVATVDALVMGRGSYEKVLTFGAWPYGERKVFVLSSRPVAIAPEIAGTVEQMSGAPTELVKEVGRRGFQHLYVDGGKTIQRFLAAGLIQQIIMSRIPVLLGRGIPLFGALDQDVNLRHQETRSFANGMVQSRYEVDA